MPSTFIYRADAAANQQVVTVKITAYDAATTYIITINYKEVQVVGNTDVNTTASDLCTALQNSDYPEFQEITWSVSTDTITGTANVAGKPFAAVSSKSGGTGTIGAVTTTTASSGPEDLLVTDNYYNASAGTTGALPSAGDTLVFENLQTYGAKYNLDALNAIALAKVIFRNCSVDFGLPAHTGLYWEYRKTYLELNSAIVEFDCPDCGLARINSLTAQVAFTVRGTGPSKIPGLETLLWTGTHASNVVYVDRGSVGIAVLTNESATIATLYQGYVSQPDSDAVVRVGANGNAVTLGAVNRIGGTMELYVASMTGAITQRERAGTLTMRGGSGTFPTITAHSGDVLWLGQGTITDMTLGQDVSFDARQNEVGFTITNAVTMVKGSRFLDPMRKATASAGFALSGCTVAGDVYIDRGPNPTIIC